LEKHCELDNHIIIDTLGVGIKYFSSNRLIKELDRCRNFYLPEIRKYEFGENILRGIEVKVSRSDFKNGFICTGCNYHYVLSPMRLIAPYEIPEGIGLIEYNKYKFSARLNQQLEMYPESRPFQIKGLRLVKKPRFQHVPRFQVDNAIMEIINKKQSQYRMSILQEIEKNIESMTYQKREIAGISDSS
jgi:hypothetical protein